MESAHAHRKDEHLAIAESQYRQRLANDAFQAMRLVHHGLPELAITDVSLKTHVLDTEWQHPFYIEAMTGGSNKTTAINQQLAEIAQATNLAMAVGSESIALKDPTSQKSFTIVRKSNPHGFIMANLGASHSVENAQRVVDLINANALEIHINSAQEVVMPEGDRDFHWLKNIEAIVNHLSVPVIVKEVGFGISKKTIQQLQNIGVKHINVGGRGGTNFATIEDRRNHAIDYAFLADWGQTTLESLIETQIANSQKIEVLATGGINSPLDILKAQVMGAKAVGIAGHFLHTLLTEKQAGLHQEILNWQYQLQQLFALVGAKDQHALTTVDYILSPTLLNYYQQRQTQNPK